MASINNMSSKRAKDYIIKKDGMSGSIRQHSPFGMIDLTEEVYSNKESSFVNLLPPKDKLRNKPLPDATTIIEPSTTIALQSPTSTTSKIQFGVFNKIMNAKDLFASSSVTRGTVPAHINRGTAPAYINRGLTQGGAAKRTNKRSDKLKKKTLKEII